MTYHKRRKLLTMLDDEKHQMKMKMKMKMKKKKKKKKKKNRMRRKKMKMKKREKENEHEKMIISFCVSFHHSLCSEDVCKKQKSTRQIQDSIRSSCQDHQQSMYCVCPTLDSSTKSNVTVSHNHFRAVQNYIK